MYGFAFSGFFFGLGSKLAQGDIVYHGLIGVGRKNTKSLMVLLLVSASAILFSWLLDSKHMNFFANAEVNPAMEFMHIQSANITICLGIVLFVISLCWMMSKT